MKNIRYRVTQRLTTSSVRCLLLLAAFAVLLPTPLVLPQAQAQSTAIDQVEMEFWKSVRDSKNPAELEAYLAAFPKGKFEVLARIRLNKMKAKTQGPAPRAAVNVSPAPATPPNVAARPTPPIPPAPVIAKTPPPVHDCDRLAANPGDLFKVATGVLFEEMRTREAIAACRTALKANPGTPRFHYQLGRALHKQKRFAEALEAYKIAAEKGYLIAYSIIGRMYIEAKGVAKDPAEAARWFHKGEEKGSALAMISLGRMYKHGLGVPKNPAEAMRWFDRASEQGSSNAMIVLALMYEKGEEVPHNSKTAAKHAFRLLQKRDQFAYEVFEVLKVNWRGFSQDFYRELQRLLKASGEYDGPTDGKFTWTAVEALEAYLKQPQNKNLAASSSGQSIMGVPSPPAPPPPSRPSDGGADLGNF